MELIQSYLKEHSNIPYVIDPVMLAKSGALMDENTKNHLQSTLLPLADVVTRIYLKLRKLLVLKLMMKKAYVKQVKSLLMKLVVRVL